jgi:opacity protein-like surface antigen
LALRLRERIEKVLDWAKANDYRDGENPALWKGNLKLRLPTLPKNRKQHMAALPYGEIPAFMAKLRATDDSLHRARALEFTILTAARSAETFWATWDEIDLTQSLWTVSKERMKAGEAHVVPLSDRAMHILRGQQEVQCSQFVFPGHRDERPMSNTQMLTMLIQLGVKATVHGFRSTFRDWAGDKTHFPRDVIEMATDFNVAPVTLTGKCESPNPCTFTTPGFAGSDRTYPDGFMGGGQIDYNWQYSPLIVLGVEADFQGALERDSGQLNNSFSCIVCLPLSSGGIVIGATSLTETSVTEYTTKIEWFGTARVRIGYVWGNNGEVLSYVTGGLAYGKVDLGGTSTVSGLSGLGPFSVTNSLSHNAVNTGWVVGYGTEGKLLIPGWTYKIEGLWMDLGHLDTTGVTSGVSFSSSDFSSVAGNTVTAHSHFTDGILRAGLNYQFH